MNDADVKRLNKLTDEINKLGEKKTSYGLLGSFFVLILSFGLAIPVYMLCATVGTDLWTWFITPIFGIALGKAQFLGVLIAVNFITNYGNIRGTNKAIDEAGPISKVILIDSVLCVYMLSAWAVGAIVVTYVM